jgi:hypothetical protein
VFHTKEYGQNRKTYNNEVCIKGLTFNEFKVDYYGKLEEVIELQYHSEQNRVFPHHGLIKINSKARLRNNNDVFVFVKQC